MFSRSQKSITCHIWLEFQCFGTGDRLYWSNCAPNVPAFMWCALCNFFGVSIVWPSRGRSFFTDTFCVKLRWNRMSPTMFLSLNFSQSRIWSFSRALICHQMIELLQRGCWNSAVGGVVAVCVGTFLKPLPGCYLIRWKTDQN